MFKSYQAIITGNSSMTTNINLPEYAYFSKHKKHIVVHHVTLMRTTSRIKKYVHFCKK